MPSSVAASARASTGSSQSSRRRPSPASSIRPAALMRGPSAKPSVCESGTPRAPATSSRAARPARSRRASTRRPWTTKARLRPDQRHHVADRGQRHEVEQAHQVGLGPCREVPGPAQHAHGGDGGEERDARGTQRSHAGAAVEPVGVDGGQHRRRRALAGVVVEHQDLGMAAQRAEHRRGGGAAVDADDEAGALPRQPAQRGLVRAVALARTVRHVGEDGAAEAAQHAGHDRAGAGAVHVVVAEHGHRLAGGHGPREAVGRGLHVDQRVRVGQQRAQRRLEEVGRGVLVDAAGGQQAAQQLGHAEALGEAEADALGGGVPPQPAPSGEAAGHAQHVQRLHRGHRPCLPTRWH